MTLDELPLAPVSVLPDEATNGYVVAVDSTGVPTALGVAASPSDSSRGPGTGGFLPSVVLLPASLTVYELLTGEAVTLLTLNPFGAVVIDASRVVGVLEHETIVRYAAAVDVPPGRTRSDLSRPEDAVLAGVVGVPVARVQCCCGRLNHVTLYDPDYPPTCTGDDGHPLVPRER